jgi:hypothetical protein
MKMWSQLIIDLLTLFVLIITAVFVIKYWAETQEMKDQMVRQNQISVQSIQASNMPLIDLQLEVIKSDPQLAHAQIQFGYDMVLLNKGNGPAFNIIVQRFTDPEKNRQKLAIHGPPKTKLRTFVKKASILGKGERLKIYREQSESYEYMRLVVSYRDYFRERHQIVFEGDRDGIELKEYPALKEVFDVEKSSKNEGTS